MKFSELEKTENGETLENLVNSSAEGAKGIPLISQAKGQGSINKTVFLFFRVAFYRKQLYFFVRRKIYGQSNGMVTNCR
jgi:hypothetical protein